MKMKLRRDRIEQTAPRNQEFNHTAPASQRGQAAHGRRAEGVTDLDELHPLDSLGADGHHGEADGGANNAVSPGDRQLEERGD